MQAKRNKASEELSDVSKVELLLGLSDQDEFQIKGHISHLYRYEKDKNAIFDETGAHISGDMLLLIINHPDWVVNHGKGINSYQLLNEMMSKHVLYGVCLFLCGLFSFFQMTRLLSPSYSLSGIIFFVLFLISVLGTGINLGMLVIKIILNKESYI